MLVTSLTTAPRDNLHLLCPQCNALANFDNHRSASRKCYRHLRNWMWRWLRFALSGVCVRVLQTASIASLKSLNPWSSVPWSSLRNRDISYVLGRAIVLYIVLALAIVALKGVDANAQPGLYPCCASCGLENLWQWKIYLKFCDVGCRMVRRIDIYSNIKPFESM
jgi:hypothetical protein